MIQRNTGPTNTPTTYGWVERAFHWAIALLIPTAIILGVIAHDAPFDTDAALSQKATLFSLHKTIGLVIFFVALARIAWAVRQPRPGRLHPERRGEAFLAALVHWLLYGSLLLVPAFGWAHHASSVGFAPIWWPFGQSLPFLPKDPALSARLATLHMVFERVMVISIALHVIGTLKHSIIDKDSTFQRMWRGVDPGALPAARRHSLPLIAALAIWAAALALGVTLSGRDTPASTAPFAPSARVDGGANWTVEDGTLSITIQQMGSGVTGAFADWQATIVFDPEGRADGTSGSVEVVVSTASLTLGSVTAEATGPGFLSSAAFPQAIFRAALRQDGADLVADGTLSLRGQEVPLRLPFTLMIQGDRAEMNGTATLDRRDFGIGNSYGDESNVGFSVAVTVALTALRRG